MKLDEVARTEMPIKVSMTGKLISAHFKRGGPAVYLVDKEFWEGPMKIYGYQWKPSNSEEEGDHLALRVATGSSQREIVYPGSSIKHLRLEKSSLGDWYLKVDL